jgi:transcriptional regulator GlxA family with amidase domain
VRYGKALNATSRAHRQMAANLELYQDEPEKAYGYVMDAAELLHAVAASVFGRPHFHNDTRSTAPLTRRGGLAPWVVRKVSTYVETHLGSTISGAELAALAQQSVYHFSRAFRQSFDEPPHTYLMRRRIERAKGSMVQTNLPLAQIAIDCGLADQPHLNKSFRRLVGQSPGAWRRARAVAPASNDLLDIMARADEAGIQG